MEIICLNLQLAERLHLRIYHYYILLLCSSYRKVSLFETEFDLTEFIHGTCRCLVKVNILAVQYFILK